MIAIVDYGSGNLHAIANIYQKLKIPHVVTSDVKELSSANRYVLPGVGSFDATMRILNSSKIRECLEQQVVKEGKNVLGICVGMQILGEASEEGVLPGLGWIKGSVKKIANGVLQGIPQSPHMGWNCIVAKSACPLLDQVDYNRGFYFLHSYYFKVESEVDSAAVAFCGKEFTCVVSHKNIFGVQFHPEKSHDNGVKLFENFAEI